MRSDGVVSELRTTLAAGPWGVGGTGQGKEGSDVKFELVSFLNLYLFPTGRREFCLRRFLKALEGTELAHLRARVERGLAHEAATLQLEDRWLGNKGDTEHGPGARALDAELDRALGALDENLASTAKAFGEDSPRGRAAGRARALLFPKGVQHVTHLPYVQQAAAVRALLERAETVPELANLDELGVAGIVERVRELNVAYDRALGSRGEGASFERVEAARKRGQTNLCEIVFVAIAHLVESGYEGEQAEALGEALREVIAQNEAIKRYYRRRRRVADVDPVTGEELEPAGEEAPEGLPADAELEVPAEVAEPIEVDDSNDAVDAA